MRTRLEFSFNSSNEFDQYKLKNILQADSLRSAVEELLNYMRGIWKHGTSTDEVLRQLNADRFEPLNLDALSEEQKELLVEAYVEGVSAMRDKIYELLRDYEINLD